MPMTENSYRKSLRTRMRVLFSPARSALFAGALLVAVIGNILYIRDDGAPEWLGALSVSPIFAFLFWELATDVRRRRDDREREEREP